MPSAILVPSDNLPFNIAVVYKLSYNKDKILNIKINRNTLFIVALWRLEMN